MSHSDIPPTTVQRLPMYLRCLVEAQSQRVEVISSARIAELCGTNSAQVRKDLSYLGEYGTRGLGYGVDDLVDQFTMWLGLEHARRAAIVGFGRLGGALVSYGGFQDRGLSVVAVFDADTEKVGTPAGGDLTVMPVEKLREAVAALNIEVVIVTVPADVAQSVADEAVAGGVRAILNFAPVRLVVPEDVVVRQADLAGELQILSFHLGVAERKNT